MMLLSLIFIPLITFGIIRAYVVPEPCEDIHPICSQLCSDTCQHDAPPVGLILTRRKRFEELAPDAPPADASLPPQTDAALPSPSDSLLPLPSLQQVKVNGTERVKIDIKEKLKGGFNAGGNFNNGVSGQERVKIDIKDKSKAGFSVDNGFGGGLTSQKIKIDVKEKSNADNGLGAAGDLGIQGRVKIDVKEKSEGGFKADGGFGADLSGQGKVNLDAREFNGGFNADNGDLNSQGRIKIDLKEKVEGGLNAENKFGNGDQGRVNVNEKFKLDVKGNFKRIDSLGLSSGSFGTGANELIYALCPKACGKCDSKPDLNRVAGKFTIQKCPAKDAAPKEAPVGLAVE